MPAVLDAYKPIAVLRHDFPHAAIDGDNGGVACMHAPCSAKHGGDGEERRWKPPIHSFTLVWTPCHIVAPVLKLWIARARR